MSYTRATTVDSSPTGDSVKQAILDLDTDVSGAFTALNEIEGNVNLTMATAEATVLASGKINALIFG